MTLPAFEWTGLAAALVEHERYRPLQRLGKKAGRQTLLCEERATGRRVVIKLLSFGEEFAWQDLKLFEREAETLRSLNHPAIPKYLDYFDLETPATKGFALVQSYIEARSLQQQLEAGRSFSEADIQQIGEDLLGILEYLHGRQPPVIHRDIKPSNILLGDRTAHSPGQVYLVDFGSVQTLAAREGSTVTVVGTYGYMPPEQFGGRAVPASDLYSLGATLIYLASGRHPADLPQRDFRIQFEDVVNLTAPTVAWLQLLTEPSLDRRASSTENAAPNHIQILAKIDQYLIAKSDTKSLINLKPASSKIKAAYEPQDGLILKIPHEQISLHTSANATEENWKGCFKQILIASLMLSLIAVHPKFILLSYLVVFAIMIIRSDLHVGMELLITSQEIQISSLHRKFLRSEVNNSLEYRKTQKFVPSKDCRLSPFPELKLFLGTHELSFNGTREELLWLEQLLHNELELIKKDRE